MPHYTTTSENQLFWLDPGDVEALLATLPEGAYEVGEEDGERIRLKIIAPSPEDVLSLARAKRDSLIAYATLRIDPLQDDVDLDEATPEGIALLKAWKKYRSEVNKTETRVGWPDSPNWPEPPVALE